MTEKKPVFPAGIVGAVPGMRSAIDGAMAAERDAARAAMWAHNYGLNLTKLRGLTLGGFADHIKTNTAWDAVEIPSYVIATLAAMAPRVESDEPEHAKKNQRLPDDNYIRRLGDPFPPEEILPAREHTNTAEIIELTPGSDTFTVRYTVHSPGGFIDAVTGEFVSLAQILDDCEPVDVFGLEEEAVPVDMPDNPRINFVDCTWTGPRFKEPRVASDTDTREPKK